VPMGVGGTGADKKGQFGAGVAPRKPTQY
jgi:hypothetical protein